jgi:8-amino-7-oxononanoate synthase
MQPRTPRTIQQALVTRETSGLLRELCDIENTIDLCSNDYLGLSRRLVRDPIPEVERIGATGSRLVSGNSRAHEEFERYLAEVHQCEAALVFGSGYEANLGLLSCIADRGDTIIFDDLCHASMRDGIRLSFARSFSFRHSDLDDLRKKIQSARGECFIAVESVYSMDGDIAPIVDLCKVAEEYGAHLIVDEAHATGIFGAQGEGLTQSLGLSARVFARVHTFGKALGYKGACVVGSGALRSYLINFARPFIYSTAPDSLSLVLMRRAYDYTREATMERQHVWSLIDQFRGLRSEFPVLEFLDAQSPIQGVVVPGNRAVVEVEHALLGSGYAVRAIRSPTVPAGRERIRICLHAFNSIAEIQASLAIVTECITQRGAHAV